MKDLTALADGPTLRVKIGEIEYEFSEMPISHMKQLQDWIRKNSVHPVEAIKPHLRGLDPEVQVGLLDKARVEAKDWPLQIGTSRGVSTLLSGEAGQIEALFVALSVHQPQTTREQTLDIYKRLQHQSRKDRDSLIVARIYSVMFGRGDPLEEDEDAPK